MQDHPADLFGREVLAILARVFGDKVEPFTPELELIFAEIDRNPQQFVYDPCRIRRNPYNGSAIRRAAQHSMKKAK